MESFQAQPKRGRIVVGVDAGGTTVRLVCLDDTTGQVAAEIHGAAASDGGPEPVAELLRKALLAAAAPPSSIAAVWAGITKYTRAGVRQRWETELRGLLPHLPGMHRQVVPDFVVAFHGALPDGVGVGAIAGTGSVVYGEDGRGGTVRVGGRGWEYGDEGSGAWLTTEAIRRTLRALDGMERETQLNGAVCSHLETRDPALLAEAARRRAEFDGRGFLVPLLLEAARNGEEEATNLFVGAAGWLAAQVRAARSRLIFREDASISVATIGGLWEVGVLINEPFRHLIERWIPEGMVVVPDAAPVFGAARLARRALTTCPPPP